MQDRVKDPCFAQGGEQRSQRQSQKPQQMTLLNQRRPTEVVSGALGYPQKTERKKKSRRPCIQQLFRLQSHEKYVPWNEMLFIWPVPSILCTMINSQGFLAMLGVTFRFQRSTNEAWFPVAVFLFSSHLLPRTHVFLATLILGLLQINSTGKETEEVTKEF